MTARGHAAIASQAETESVPLQERAAYELLRCPETGERLVVRGDQLERAGDAHRWPIVRGIPRFVSSDAYAASFGFEWNLHNTTQIDSVQSSDISERTLMEKTGLRPDLVRGKRVLDAGCGAGRFTEVLLRWGAEVVAADLSRAVDATFMHVGSNPRAMVVQADIGALPLAPASFDFIISIGVLHHTPDTHQYFLRLPPLLKPGGTIAIWVYPDEGDYQKRLPWIPFTGRLPSSLFHGFCKTLVHWMRRHPRHPLAAWVQDVFPVSNQQFGIENDILDTFDGFSPRFHGVHSPEEVTGWFREAGLASIEVLPINTSVRGRRPSGSSPR